jgi:hypothetical protein
MLRKRFDKAMAQLRHKETVCSAVMFTPEGMDFGLVNSWVCYAILVSLKVTFRSRRTVGRVKQK